MAEGRGPADSQYGGESHDFLFHNDRSHRKKLLSICSGAVIGRIPFVPVVPVVPEVVAVAAHAGLVAVVGETVGNVGIDELSPSVPTRGNTFGNGTGGVEPTPRLPISNDPNGIPVRAPPPGVVGIVDVGLDDAATLLEPEPHIPDIPDVSSTPDDPEVTGISDVTEVVDDVDVPDAIVVPDIAVSPELAAEAGTAVPTDMPPPSKLAVDPNISEGGVAAVGHAVLVVAVGIVIVPVTPVGTGLTPGVVIPTAPSGIPVGELVEPIAMPSGEVAPIVGVGVTVPSNCPSTCAMAALQTTSARKTAAITDSLAIVLLLNLVSPILETVDDSRRDFAMSTRWRASCDVAAPVLIGFATSSPDAELSDIGQSPVLLWSMLTPDAGWLAKALRGISIANDRCLAAVG
jgi:hypothetical protein